MLHRPKATATLLLALLLSAATPAAAIYPADAPGPGTTAERTPLDTNLLRNGGFGQVSAGDPIPYWTESGDVHVETFGTRSWPYPAYGKKWGGGSRYLTCGTKSGLVRQAIDLVGWEGRTGDSKLAVRMQADFGGTIGHKIRLTLRATGGDVVREVEKLKVLDITNHYKQVVVGFTLDKAADHIVATVELIRKDGSARCKMVADTVKLVVSHD